MENICLGSALLATRHLYCSPEINLLMFASPSNSIYTHNRNSFNWQICVPSVFLNILSTNEIFLPHTNDSKNCFHFPVNYYSLHSNNLKVPRCCHSLYNHWKLLLQQQNIKQRIFMLDPRYFSTQGHLFFYLLSQIF